LPTGTVLRKGKISAGGKNGPSAQELARLMVGREVLFRLEKKPSQPGPTVLSVENVQAENDKGLPSLRGVSFLVRAGEVVGLAGVAGNGQIELTQVINGLRPCTQGKVKLFDEDITNCPTVLAIRRGMAYIPEDRTHVGTAPNLSITDNVIMKNIANRPGAWLDTGCGCGYAVCQRAERGL
jgi:simple sugar transport system ATP-binding protein